jgi:hypothetical protein
MEVVCTVNVSEEYAASIFRIEMSRASEGLGYGRSYCPVGTNMDKWNIHSS